MKAPSRADWINVIKHYSSKELTYSGKLSALSSIAGYFQKRLNDNYLAGLWAGDLLYQLCW
jgi:hypothetical protein